MSQAARKRAAAPLVGSPDAFVEPTSPSEIAAVLRDTKRYPGPVRPVGSGSSTTRCIAAAGGTVMSLAGMNRVLNVTKDAVTVQPGIALPDLAEVLSEQGLELIGGFDLANRTVGGAVCAAGLEAALAGEVGQFAAHVVRLKVLSPGGRKFEVTEKTRSLLAMLRLSYGLLGVVYEITLRVRPVQGFAVHTGKVSFENFARALPRVAASPAGIKLYMLPFRDRIYIELRRPAAEGDPGRKLAWRLKDWATYSALPGAIRSLGRVVPMRKLRYPLIDGLSDIAQTLMAKPLLRSGSNAAEQSGRFRGLDARERFNYCTWAFPATRFAEVALAYRDFCAEHYERTGFRCDLPTIGFRLNLDKSALLSPAFEQAMLTLSPLSTQSEGWDDFVLELADFSEGHAGVPFFNQTKNATAQHVAQSYGPRLNLFRKVRKELDPHDRLLNQFFAAYMTTG
jgi:hypothetical protein